MDFEEALEVLRIKPVLNYDDFRAEVTKNWKKLLIRNRGSNDREAARINRAYDFLKRISNEEFNQIIKNNYSGDSSLNDDKSEDIFSEESSLSNDDIFEEDKNQDLFIEENNSPRVTFGFDTKSDRNYIEEFNKNLDYEKSENQLENQPKNVQGKNTKDNDEWTADDSAGCFFLVVFGGFLVCIIFALLTYFNGENNYDDKSLKKIYIGSNQFIKLKIPNNTNHLKNSYYFDVQKNKYNIKANCKIPSFTITRNSSGSNVPILLYKKEHSNIYLNLCEDSVYANGAIYINPWKKDKDDCCNDGTYFWTYELKSYNYRSKVFYSCRSNTFWDSNNKIWTLTSDKKVISRNLQKNICANIDY